MDDCPRFCATCPMVPRGVTAVLTGSEVITMTALRRWRFAHDAPQVAAMYVGLTRIHTEAIASSVPHIEVGDTAAMIVDADGKDHAGLKEVIQNCKGPIFTRLERFFKIFRPAGRCGAVDHKKDIAHGRGE